MVSTRKHEAYPAILNPWYYMTDFTHLLRSCRFFPFAGPLLVVLVRWYACLETVADMYTLAEVRKSWLCLRDAQSLKPPGFPKHRVLPSVATRIDPSLAMWLNFKVGLQDRLSAVVILDSCSAHTSTHLLRPPAPPVASWHPFIRPLTPSDPVARLVACRNLKYVLALSCQSKHLIPCSPR